MCVLHVFSGFCNVFCPFPSVLFVLVPLTSMIFPPRLSRILFNHPGPVSWVPPRSVFPPHLQCISLISPTLHLIPSLISLDLGPVFCSVICSVFCEPAVERPLPCCSSCYLNPEYISSGRLPAWGSTAFGSDLLCFTVTFAVPSKGEIQMLRQHKYRREYR